MTIVQYRSLDTWIYLGGYNLRRYIQVSRFLYRTIILKSDETFFVNVNALISVRRLMRTLQKN